MVGVDADLAVKEAKVFNPLERFDPFCGALKIDTKDYGRRPLALMGSQRYLLQRIREGLSRGIHTFVVLKARQQGISTLGLALDLYWCQKFPGIQGALVTDTETNRDFFKSVLELYHESLPVRFKRPIRTHNRNQLVFQNRSRLQYIVAGTRGGSAAGRGRPINFLHSTEMSSYGDADAVASLQATLAEHYKHRFFLYESTARGYNLFYDQWRTAQRATTAEAIFIGWWRMESYSLERTDPRFKVYWDGAYSAEEREWLQAIRSMYHYEVTPQQVAWYRWKLAEVINDPVAMHENYPHTEEDAFVVSGSQFFSSERLTECLRRARDERFDRYRYSMATTYDTVRVRKSRAPDSELRIWQEPDKNGLYLIGADPAYGSTSGGDNFVIEIFRGYADRIEQVAEFCTDTFSTYQFAWVLAHLAGAYRNCYVNLEVTGPGTAVFDELKRLRSQSAGMRMESGETITDVLSNMRFYLYHRPDSMGNGFAYCWKSSQDINTYAMTSLRDFFERGMLVLHSIDLIAEMRTIMNDGGRIGASGRAKDDRVFATMFAAVAWRDWAQPALAARRYTYAASKLAPSPEVLSNPLHKVVFDYLKGIKIDPR